MTVTRLIPNSMRGRLLAAGVLFTTIAMVVAIGSIGAMLDRFVRRGLDERLDAQIALLVRSVRPDGSIDRHLLEEIGPFTQHRRGWGWRIDAPEGSFTSRQVVPLGGVREEEWRRRAGRPDRRMRPIGERPRSGASPESYVRSLRKPTTTGVVRITVAAPRATFDRARRAAILPVLATLLALGVLLLLATLLQLRLGLRPLVRLQRSLAAIRSGALDRIAPDQPAELAPVVAELNALLDENEAALTRARGHVANLAHGLKTPLATLALRLGEPGRDPDGELGALVAQVDHAIRHHLGRARAASPGAPGRAAVPLGPVVDELMHALGRIHADRALRMRAEIPADLGVGCDPQDLSEMLGNLLDNACKWAMTSVSATARAEGDTVRIDVEDDGPGLSPEAIAQALMPGRRLDERADGHGFGLPIARELAELHGGALRLGTSALGGLCATLILPR